MRDDNSFHRDSTNRILKPMDSHPWAFPIYTTMIKKEDLKGMKLWQAVQRYPECFQFRDGKSIGNIHVPQGNKMVATGERAKPAKSLSGATVAIAYPFGSIENSHWQSYSEGGVFGAWQPSGQPSYESDKDLLLIKPLP